MSVPPHAEPPGPGAPAFAPPGGADPTFAPPSGAWLPVSPRLTAVKRITASLWLLPVTLGAAVGAWLAWGLWWPTALVAAAGGAVWVWLFVRARRVVASWGYAERDADLCITSGIHFRELLVVPFGRMQVVKVSSGPLQRAFGLATVELVTASTQTNATIPGLPLAEARALRDRMIELSDSRGSGL